MIYFRENVWTLNHYFFWTWTISIHLPGRHSEGKSPRPIFTNYASILRHFKPSHKTNILGSQWTPTDSELRSSVFRATGGKRKSIILQINVQNVERLTCWRFLQECYFRSSAQNSRVEPWQVKEILIPLFLAFLTLQCRPLSVSRLIFLLSVGGNSFSRFVSSQPF